MVSLWNAHERANHARDWPSIQQLDGGTALLEEHYALAGLVCGCWKWYWTKAPRSIRSLTVYLPRQNHYPLYFMASVLAAPPGAAAPGAGQATALLIVTRQAPSEPWRITTQVWDTGYDPPGGPVPAPQPDADGYDVVADGPDTTSALKWPSMLAAYYRRLKDTGAPAADTPFLPGALTTGTDLAVRRQGYTADGFVSHYAFTAGGNGGPWLIGMGGQLFACANVLETATETPAKPKAVFVQHDGPGQAWGPDLDSGYYSKVVETFEWPVCIARAAGGLQVVGPTSGSYPIHNGGVPAKLEPGMTALA